MIRQQLEIELIAAAKKLYPAAQIDWEENCEVGYPPDYFDADYSSNAGLRLASAAQERADAIAERLAETLKTVPFYSANAASIKTVNGFLNFKLKDDFLIDKINVMAHSRRTVHFGPARSERKNILIEFISANPTGPLTLGNARGAFLGDVLSNVLAASGSKVTREYYINNAKNSKQIQELGKTCLGKSQSYLTPYLARLIYELGRKKKIPQGEREAGYLLSSLVQKHNHAFITRKLKIKFDAWFKEEELYRQKAVQKTFALLKENNLVYEKDGAQWMKTSDYGDEEDRVLIRSDGEATYFLTDIAYHLDKYTRGYDALIDIWGADHHGHVKRLHAALRALGKPPQTLHVIITQIVRLIEGEEIAKMSKRAGMYVTLEELIDDVGVDAARFFFLMRSAHTHIDFDLELAREKSEKNPVYYIQYAYVRAGNILAKAKKERIPMPRRLPHGSVLVDERPLMVLLLRFDEIVFDIAKTHHVHQLTNYLTDTARAFHNFYERARVLQESNKELRGVRLALCAATHKILGAAFDLMGISRPKKM